MVSEKVRKVLIEYKEKNNLSNAQMARKLDIDPQTLTHWLNGGCVSVDKIDKAIRNIGLRIAIARVKE